MTRVLIDGCRVSSNGDVALVVEERPSWFARVFLGRIAVRRHYRGQGKKWVELPAYRFVSDHQLLYRLRCLQAEWIERECARLHRRRP